MGLERVKFPEHTREVIEYCYSQGEGTNTDELISSGNFQELVCQFINKKEYDSLKEWLWDNGYREEIGVLEDMCKILDDEGSDEDKVEMALNFLETFHFHIYAQAQLAYHREQKDCNEKVETPKVATDLRKVF